MCVRCEKTKLILENAIIHRKRYQEIEETTRKKYNKAIDNCWDKE